MIIQLHPKVEKLWLMLVGMAAEKNIKIVQVCGFRSIEEQNKLYASGRTVKGNIVTNCKGGQSYHNYGLAVDFVPIINGKCDWNDKWMFAEVGKLGEFLGFEWGGHFKKLADFDHLQYTFGYSIKRLQHGDYPSVIEK
jgi:peptidoglycan LD-endopeptidase CwlK